MKELNFKPLTAEQIEVRPTDTKVQGKCTLLLYIDSRCAAKILNDTVGVMNWQISYKDVAGTIYGRLDIWDEDRNCWVYKEDTGSEANIEAEKSKSSDILKRCLARWGCDYLYYTPKIKIDCPPSFYFNNKMTMTFTVADIAFNDNKQCTKLVILDRFNNVVFDWSNGQQNNTQQQKPTTPKRNKLTTTTNMSSERIPTGLYGKTVNAQSMAALKSIWDSNELYHNNKIFINLVNKQKAALSAAS